MKIFEVIIENVNIWKTDDYFPDPARGGSFHILERTNTDGEIDGFDFVYRNPSINRDPTYDHIVTSITMRENKIRMYDFEVNIDGKGKVFKKYNNLNDLEKAKNLFLEKSEEYINTY